PMRFWLSWANSGQTLKIALPHVAIKCFDPHSGKLQSQWTPSADDSLSADIDTRDAQMKKRFSTLPPALRQQAERAYGKRKDERKAKLAAPQFGQVKALSQDGKW